jgi:hypothetical protein
MRYSDPIFAPRRVSRAEIQGRLGVQHHVPDTPDSRETSERTVGDTTLPGRCGDDGRID